MAVQKADAHHTSFRARPRCRYRLTRSQSPKRNHRKHLVPHPCLRAFTPSCPTKSPDSRTCSSTLPWNFGPLIQPLVSCRAPIPPPSTPVCNSDCYNEAQVPAPGVQVVVGMPCCDKAARWNRASTVAGYSKELLARCAPDLDEFCERGAYAEIILEKVDRQS